MFRRMTLAGAPLSALLALTAGTAGAQRATPPRDSTRPQRLTPVVTTSTRYSSSPQETPRRLEVISRSQIEATAAVELVDVLKKRSSVDVIQYPGQLSGVGIRGFRPQFSGITQRTLVLIDGRPSGATNLSLIDLSNIERIDVIKGPSSALYGSSAVGGVVNVITRRRTGRRTGEFMVQGGAFGTSDLNLSGGGSLGLGFDGDASVRRFEQRDDFTIGSGNTFRGLLGGERAFKTYPLRNRPDRFVSDSIGDGVVRPFTSQSATTAQLRMGRFLGSHLRVDVTGEGYRGDDIPTPGDIFQNSPSRKDVERIGASADLRGTFGRFSPLLRVYRTDEENDSYNVPDSSRFVSNESRTRTDGIQAQSTASWSATKVTFGVDLTRQRAASDRFSSATVRIAPFSPDAQIRSVAGFLELERRWLTDRIITTVGGRYDRVRLGILATAFRPDITAQKDDFAVFNPSAGVRWRLGRGVSLHGSGGRGFVAPDPFGRAGLSVQPAAPGSVNVTIGNATLRPESSITYDGGIGILSATGALEADLTYFTTDVTDRSVTARASFTGTTRPRLADGSLVNRVDTRVNAGGADIRGFELSARYDFLRSRGKRESLSLYGNATRIFTANERAPAVTVDGARFAGQTNFDPARVFDGVVFGTSTTARVKNIADLTMSAGLEYDDHRRYRLALNGRYVGHRLDTDFSDPLDVSDIRYPRMMQLDLITGLQITSQIRVLGTLANLTDENYYEKRGFNLPGRAFSLRIVTRF